MTATTDARRDGRGSTLPRPSASRARYGSPTGLIVKIVLLGFVNAVGIWGISVMIAEPDWALAISAMVALALIDVVYLSKRFIPAKYLLPGTLFLVAFVLYPVIYTIYISTTNYGTGNNLSREQAITQIERRSIRPADESIRYDLQILAEGGPTGQLAYLLTDPDGDYFLGTAEGLAPVSPDDVRADGRRETVEGYVALNSGQAQDRVADVREFVVPSPAGDIVNDGFGAALARLQGLRYDVASGTIVDTVDGSVYVEEGGYFVAEDGSRLLPGWRSSVGLDNYQRLFENEQIRSNFSRVFVWTFLFALFTVALQFGLGLFLAIVFHNARMRGRRYYRSLLIIPYAIPSFMTALVWQGMMNQRFGVLNRWLGTDFGWLDSQWLPYFSILLVSMWLGWPYMFLVCTGALQSIPDDLTEAAKVDGASGPMRFRRITFPLLLIAVSPLLIASFAFNFNNFNIIYLLTEGRPPVPGSVAGRTDILITYTYKLAFAGGRGADYGFAAAVSFVIFVITAVISAIGFHFTRTYEELR
jgi:arabinogalactan oligomer / maltooligosaccharide transport system permease protein